MARRSMEERNFRTLFRFAKRSVAITLPIEMIRDLDWRYGQRIHIRKIGKRIVIEEDGEEQPL